MADQNYILSYNPASINPTAQALQVFITQNRDIGSWYLAFLGTYILKSPKGLADLNAQFSQLFGGSPYILTFAPTHFATGSLPMGIWNWFNGTVNPFLPSA